MPYPFALPTTSVLSFPQHYQCTSHPSLPHQATASRGLVRAALKAYKRLPPDQKPGQLNTVRDALLDYIPYLRALSAGLSNERVAGEDVQVDLVHDIVVEWRPTLSAAAVPGREVARAKLHGLDAELAFTLHTLALTYYLQARALQRSLYDRQMSDGALPPEARTALIVPAVKALLDGHAIWTYLTARPLSIPAPAPADIHSSTLTALAALALSESTSLTVLKDDPLPHAVATALNANDKSWLTGAPPLPHVRALLFARLSLAAADHAARAAGILTVAPSAPAAPATGPRLAQDQLPRYAADVRRAARARACRFLGVDAEGAGRSGEAVGWVRAASAELGVADAASGDGSGGGGSSSSSAIGLAARLKHEWTARREDRRVAGARDWGADGGRVDEARVLEMCAAKWERVNASVSVQAVPAAGALLAKLPSGREIHDARRAWAAPELAGGLLAGMRGLPDGGVAGGDGVAESDEDEDGAGAGAGAGAGVAAAPPGAFPGREYF